MATFASGPDISVRLPPESLLSVEISKQEKKRRKQAKQNGKSIHIQCEQTLLPTHKLWTVPPSAQNILY